jgi:SagB-type dehydrogenase family enzyme
MRRIVLLLMLSVLCSNIAFAAQLNPIKLSQPSLKGQMSVEEAIQSRRSVRSFAGKALSLAEVGQIMWAAQGITGERGMRAAPSAGATYPLEVYLVAGKVDGLEPGIYKYLPSEHAIASVHPGDARKELSAAVMGSGVIVHASAVLVFVCDYSKTTARYGSRGEMYVHMEAGHAGQNVFLQAAALNLSTVAIGAFYEKRVADVIGCKSTEVPLYIFPIGGRKP